MSRLHRSILEERIGKSRLKMASIMIGSVFFGVAMACQKWDFERTEFTRVITIGAIEVTSSTAFLIGDTEGTIKESIEEAGFVLSQTVSSEAVMRKGSEQTFSASASSVDTTAAGAFAALITELENDQTYYFRAFVKLANESELAYGQVDSFQTGELAIGLPFVAQSEVSCGSNVAIGFEFPGFTGDPESAVGLVWSTNEVSNYPTLEDGTSMEINPDQGNLIIDIEIQCDRTYFIRGYFENRFGEVSYGDVLSFSTRPGGSWIPQPVFPGTSITRLAPVVLVSESTIYYGGGGKQGRNFDDYYRFDDQTKEWNFMYQADSLAISHSASGNMGSMLFALGGRYATTECTVCDLTPSGVLECICTSSEMLLFDPGSETWTSYAGLPGSGWRFGAQTITIADKLYFGFGTNSSFQFQCILTDGTCQNPVNCNFSNLRDCRQADYQGFSDIHAFDSDFLEWNKEDDIPGAGRIEPAVFNIQEQGYIGLGRTSLFDSDVLNDFYTFDPSKSPGSQWKRVEDFPIKYKTAIGLAIGNKGYVLAGHDESTPNSFWLFDPDQNLSEQWRDISTPALPVDGSPVAVVTEGTKAFVFLESQGDNFWMYVPELSAL